MTTQTLTLTDFLLARIAEDEQTARYAETRGRPTEADWGGWWIGHYRHFTTHDPARVLAECEAKRRIVELHDGAHECSTYDHTGEVDNYTWCLDESDCSTMQLLATVYADHPDYREEWKP